MFEALNVWHNSFLISQIAEEASGVHTGHTCHIGEDGGHDEGGLDHAAPQTPGMEEDIDAVLVASESDKIVLDRWQVFCRQTHLLAD